MVAIGIDLGTTFSCVGWWKDNRCEIIANDQGNRTTPSYVSFGENEKIVGEGAKNQATSNPENTVFDAKRLIGRKFDEKTIQIESKNLPFNIIDDGNNKPVIEVTYKNEKKTFHPEEISSIDITLLVLFMMKLLIGLPSGKNILCTEPSVKASSSVTIAKLSLLPIYNSLSILIIRSTLVSTA